MKVSHPHFAGPTGEPAPKTQTESANTPPSTELQGLSPDRFERSQTASLPSPTPLPTIQRQQTEDEFKFKHKSVYQQKSKQAQVKFGSSNEQHANEQKQVQRRLEGRAPIDRLGRTAAEREREQIQARADAREREQIQALAHARAIEQIQGLAHELNITVAEFRIRFKQALVDCTGIDIAEHIRLLEEIRVERPDITNAELGIRHREALAHRLNITVAEFRTRFKQALNIEVGMRSREALGELQASILLSI